MEAELLVINSHIQHSLDAITHHTPHALLLTGQSGVGLSTIARHIARHELMIVIQPVTTKGEVNSLAGTIHTDTIRDLYEQLRTVSTTRRIVLIDDTDRMTVSAQNTFLKLLEEPNSSTHFILTSHAPNKLLSTVISRVQHIHIPPVDKTLSTKLLDKIHDNRKKAQITYLAEGLPAEIIRLSSDEVYLSSQIEIMSDARRFLESSGYSNLALINTYSGDRTKSLALINGIIRILRTNLRTNSSRPLVVRLDALVSAYSAIVANGNVKLHMLQLVV